MTDQSDKLLRAQTYSSQLVQLITKQTMDPHLYFERKYTAEINRADSAEAVIEILNGIALWLTSPEFGQESLDRLERDLDLAGLPSVASIRTLHDSGAGALLEFLER